jgi:hypothetical protein
MASGDTILPQFGQKANSRGEAMVPHLISVGRTKFPSQCNIAALFIVVKGRQKALVIQTVYSLSRLD